MSAFVPRERRPAEPALVHALLRRCIDGLQPALRPSEAIGWAADAARQVEHLPASVLDAACLDARRTCMRVTDVVPSILATAEEIMQRPGIPFAHRPTDPAPVITQADLDAMPPELVSLGIKLGTLTRGDDGRVRLVPEDQSR